MAKCCNGHVLIKVGWPDENQPYDDKGEGVFVATLIPEHEVERIARLRALEPSFIAAAQAQNKKAN